MSRHEEDAKVARATESEETASSSGCVGIMTPCPTQNHGSASTDDSIKEGANSTSKGVLGRPLKLALTGRILQRLYKTIGTKPSEHGGVLGGSYNDGVVRFYRFDRNASRTSGTYSPDHKALNQLFKKLWNPRGIRMLGFAHSHPPTLRRPSYGDLVYAREILKAVPELGHLYLPIIVAEPDCGRFDIFPFAAVRDGDDVLLQAAELVVIDRAQDGSRKHCSIIVPDGVAVGSEENTRLAPATAGHNEQDRVAGASENKSSQQGRTNAEAVEQGQGNGGPEPTATATKEGLGDQTPLAFSRVKDAYDLSRMSRSRFIVIGTGGAASFIEDLARSFVGEFILVDPDIVTETNIGTQQTYLSDLGRPKVACLSERIAEINPRAFVLPLPLKLDDLNDAAFQALATVAFRGNAPDVTIICGLTDNFEAQARVNRLALNFGLPSLCAQVYQEGRAAEVTFTCPGATPACHRCILSSRYGYYLQGNRNNVTSAGTPIFATTRLNALKGFVALALAHHGTEHPRWGRLLERIGARNLIQIRMDPDLSASMGLTVFDRVFKGADLDRVLFDEVVWLPQAPECPENGYPHCPDCGGTGDLRNSIGQFEDTRPMRA